MKPCHHSINTHSTGLTAFATDEPGQGGACHRYEIHGADINNDPAALPSDAPNFARALILFQNGPIGNVGVNGLTQEVLLAIVIDQLRSFQAGPFACMSNAVALSHIEAGLEALNARTRERKARGVEGTLSV